MRRAMAGFIAVLLLIFLVVVVNACQDSARKNALRSWNSDASAILAESDSDVGAQFFETLRQASSSSPEDLQTDISSLRSQADEHLDRAKDLDTPDELRAAQQSFLIALEFRRNALDYVARRISAALGSEGDAADRALEEIGGEMQAFLASDTILRMRVTPLVGRALERDEVVAETVRTQGVLPGFDWLEPEFVADQLGTRLTGTRTRERNEPVAPGLHGNGLTGTSVNGVDLQPDPAANEVSLGSELTFSVTFANQGENDETDVPVNITLQGGTGKDIKGSEVVPAIAQGSEATAEITLDRQPTAGEVYTVNVEVEGVPGEEKTDNNVATYNVLFE